MTLYLNLALGIVDVVPAPVAAIVGGIFYPAAMLQLLLMDCGCMVVVVDGAPSACLRECTAHELERLLLQAIREIVCTPPAPLGMLN